jgi:phospholipid/cholesterol/gamma-HCH transport system substrate-binding protein
MTYLVLFLAKAKWAVAFAAVVGLTMYLPRAIDPFPAAYTLDVPLKDAAGLYAGSDVEIAGAKAGSIDAINLRSGLAVATISLDSQHSPVHRDATVDLRPKSLLGEKYLALDPGKASDTLQSGARLAPGAISQSVELQDVFNTFDKPTRDKLQVLIDQLGGGMAGIGQVQNQGIRYGSSDLEDLAAIADTLARKDQELKQVIDSLSVVTDELSRSDRRDQLAALIRNTDALMRTLADQDAQLKRALVETDLALGRTNVALGGTGGNLNSINQSLGTTVHDVNGLTNDLGLGLDSLLPNMDTFIRGIQAGPVVFGGRDSGGTGYATRISVVAGNGTVGAPNPIGGQPPTGPVPGLPGLVASDTLGGALGFLLNPPNPVPGGGG